LREKIHGGTSLSIAATTTCFEGNNITLMHEKICLAA
jgi:hypothetical protein